MFFASDNWAGAHPSIAKALLDANHGYRPSYGNADEDKALAARFEDVFETDLAVFSVATGTAANALSLSTMARPGDVMWSHNEAHIRVDECGAPFFFSQGTQLEGIASPLGKITPETLSHAIETVKAGGLNAGRSGGLTITQATESGTFYTLDEIDALVETLRSRTGQADAPVHLDGARFANALVALECTPADMTWKRGIDIVSFGGTKNGCWCAEAILIFNPELARNMDYLRKRAGHLPSKMRLMTAQWDGYLKDDLWLKLARHANNQAAKLATSINASNSIRLAWDQQINEVFAITDRSRLNHWQKKGLVVAPWWPPQAEAHLVKDGEQMIRFVTSFATTDDEIEQAANLLTS